MALIDDLQNSPIVSRWSGKGAAAVFKIDALLARPGAWQLAVIGLLALQLLLVFTHEAWLDEWQALQLALQSPDLAALFENLRYEGHPPLWYLILRGLGTFIDPYWVMPVAAALIAAATQLLLLLRSPFTKAERLLLAMGCLYLFEFMTISRSMTLGVLVLTAAMVLWRRRWVWLAIAILPMCDFLFGVLSGVLMLLQWRDRGPWWPGIALWLIVGGLSAWTIRPAPDMIQALELLGPLQDFSGWLSRIGLLLVPLQVSGITPQWNGEAPLRTGTILGLLFLAFAHVQVRGDRMQQLLFWGFVGLTLVFSLVVYPLHARHLMLIALLLILLVWRRVADGSATTAGFKLWILIGSVCGLFVAVYNLIVPFDTARQAGAEIARLGLKDKHWVVFPDSRAQGVAALTGMEFERTERNCVQNFIRWNYRTTLVKPQRLEAWLRQQSQSRGKFYLIGDMKFTKMPHDLVQMIGHIEPGYNGQHYYLYAIGPSLAEARLDLPRCVLDQRPLAEARIWPG